MISEQLKQKFIDAGQGHIFNFEKELNNEQCDILEKQLKSIDVTMIDNLYALNKENNNEDCEITPIPCAVQSELSREDYEKYNYVGTETRNVNKTTISLMGIVYIIISPLFFIFQIISLVTSIILPTQDNRLVSFYKADFDEYDVYPSFGALLLHFTTGIIVTY